MLTTGAVKFYFAYGSNMSRIRIEERIGPADHHGRAILHHYQHRFSHRGLDGTGKGNIIPVRNEVVHGVLYLLAPPQVEILHTFEGGYDQEIVTVVRASDNSTIEAYTYTSPHRAAGLLPTPSYLRHYLDGLEENFISDDYVARIRAQAGLKDDD